MSATATRERPILFSAPMVRAILDGRKTQTRRIVKPSQVIPGARTLRWGNQNPEEIARCFRGPYGQPGERLWVREAWARSESEDGQELLVYRADGETWLCDFDGEIRCVKMPWVLDETGCHPRWRPSIHMPRWASRLTLEVVGVRAQRVQDISDEDIGEEGIGREYATGEEPWIKTYEADCRRQFAALWDTVNGPGAWDRNDWVWAVEFKRVTT